MAPCIECVDLRNIYTNLTLKYRIALGESTRRVALYDLNKLRDAKIAAGQILQDHELTHHQASQQVDTPASLVRDQSENEDFPDRSR